MKLAVATDHAGYEKMRMLKDYLVSLGHECVDYGPSSFDPIDDYPDYIFPAAEAVTSGICERAIIMGGSGQGEAIAANRFAAIRCAVFYSPAIAQNPIDADGRTSNDPYEIVRLSRQHNDANVLSLSARFLTFDEMKTAIQIWLETPFNGVDRHAQRIAKLAHKGSD